VEQRIFRSRIDALRRAVMEPCDLDLLIGYSDDILSPGAVRYLTDFDMYAMYGLAIVPRRGEVALAFGLHHSAYLIRVKQAAIADYYAGTYHPGALCAELLVAAQPKSTPRVGLVGGAHMFGTIDADLRSNLTGASFIDVDREFWSHYFAALPANGVEPNLRRSAAIAVAALDHARSQFESGQRSAAQIGASAALLARRLGADVMNRELVQVLCAPGRPIPPALSPRLHGVTVAEAFALEITAPYGGQRSVYGRTLLGEGAGAAAIRERDNAMEMHARILGLLQIGTNGRQLTGEAQRLARDAGFSAAEVSAHGIGLEMRQEPDLGAEGGKALAAGMTLALRTRFTGERIGTIHNADTVLIAETSTDVLTAPA
jgi:hypothetical protein